MNPFQDKTKIRSMSWAAVWKDGWRGKIVLAVVNQKLTLFSNIGSQHFPQYFGKYL